MSFHSIKTLDTQSGLSLVEILVSLVIGLFLLGGVVQVYFSSTASYRFTNAFTEVQDKGRFALEAITRDLRAAGDWGCANFDPNNFDNFNDTSGTNLLTLPHIFGTDATNINNSDTLTIRGSIVGQANIVSPFSDTLLTLANNTNQFAVGDTALITRCGNNENFRPLVEADIFEVGAVANNTITPTQNLSQVYANDAVVKELQDVTYSIQNQVINGVNVPTLVRSVFGVDQPLIDGIESMQVDYGEDNDPVNSPSQNFLGFNTHVPSGQVNDFRNVVSVQVTFLVRSSADFVTDAPQAINFPDANNGNNPFPVNDRRIRQVFSSTIVLRNRMGIER